MCPTSMGSEEMHYPVSTRLVLAASMFWLCAAQPGQALAEASERKAYFGDLHVHTRYSADAYSFGARAGPDEAYAFARGAPLRHPSGQIIRMRGAPLDFLAVTDHAEYLGNVTALGNPDHPLSGSELTDVTDGVMMAAFLTFGSALRTGEVNPDLHDDGIRRDAWQRIVAAAERNNEPGRFTAFVGYEYTSSRDGMLHRNVVFEGARVPELPFGATDSRNPEDLWAWLDRLRGEGIEALAIAHNTNLSNGQYFETTTFDDEPLDADYAEARMRNEPIVEMTQVKGTSETHPMLSPNDDVGRLRGYWRWRPGGVRARCAVDRARDGRRPGVQSVPVRVHRRERHAQRRRRLRGACLSRQDRQRRRAAGVAQDHAP